jgi:hypothetical protein
MPLSDPTPVPSEIGAREYYPFSILIEGPVMAGAEDWLLESQRLQQSLTGTLARAYPDRWSSVALDEEMAVRRG